MPRENQKIIRFHGTCLILRYNRYMRPWGKTPEFIFIHIRDVGNMFACQTANCKSNRALIIAGEPADADIKEEAHHCAEDEDEYVKRDRQCHHFPPENQPQADSRQLPSARLFISTFLLFPGSLSESRLFLVNSASFSRSFATT